MLDPSPELFATIDQARDLSNSRLRDHAVQILMNLVWRVTDGYWAKWAKVLDEAQCHDAAVDALMASIRLFDPSKGKAFGALYGRILSRRLIDAKRQNDRKDHGTNQTESLHTPGPGAYTPHALRIADESDQYAASDDRQDGKQLRDRIMSQLNPFEAAVFEHYLQGSSYRTIAALVSHKFDKSISSKKVDNCLYSIKSRISELARATE